MVYKEERQNTSCHQRFCKSGGAVLRMKFSGENRHYRKTKAFPNFTPMKKIIIIFSLFFNFTLYAQENISKLNYAKTEIPVPENCVAKSEYEIIDCNGFSAQWLFFNDEMIKQKINEQFQAQIEEQFEYKKKKNIEFTSQNQKFKGIKYELKNGTYRIIGFGRINDIPLLLNLGFEKDPNNNKRLTEFEKNFIKLK